MANSTAATLPQKPYSDFPLYAHQSDRGAKKVRGIVSGRSRAAIQVEVGPRSFGRRSCDPAPPGSQKKSLTESSETAPARS